MASFKATFQTDTVGPTGNWEKGQRRESRKRWRQDEQQQLIKVKFVAYLSALSTASPPGCLFHLLSSILLPLQVPTPSLSTVLVQTVAFKNPAIKPNPGPALLFLILWKTSKAIILSEKVDFFSQSVSTLCTSHFSQGTVSHLFEFIWKERPESKMSGKKPVWVHESSLRCFPFLKFLAAQVVCAAPKIPSNSIPSTASTAAYYNVGNTIRFSCRPGFKMVGSSLMRCTEHGQWSSDPPTCECTSEPSESNNFKSDLDGTMCKELAFPFFFFENGFVKAIHRSKCRLESLPM